MPLYVCKLERSLFRFINRPDWGARRGFPQRAISDKAKNFKSANQQLLALFQLPSVQQYLAEKRVRSQFNLDRASKYRGIFERLIDLSRIPL